mgnify:CR=1 FL=1
MRFLFLLSLGLILLGCATNPVTQKPELMIFSEEEEIRIGREARRSVLLQFGRYHDERVQAYIREVGQKIARVSHRPHLPLSLIHI